MIRGRSSIALHFPILTLAAFLIVECSQARTTDKIGTQQIMDAINRDICFSNFWLGVDYRLGIDVSFSLHKKGNAINAWSGGLLSTGEFFSHFKIIYDESSPFVESSQSFNKKFYPELSRNLNQAEMIKLRTPTHCTPTREISTAKLGAIKYILREQFASMGKLKDGRGLPVIVANVDDRYPTSLVYIRNTKELFSVTVNPGVDPKHVDSGYYFGQIYNKSHIEMLEPKLMKFGTVVEIR